jgi:hypothetical protein
MNRAVATQSTRYALDSSRPAGQEARTCTTTPKSQTVAAAFVARAGLDRVQSQRGLVQLRS